MLSTHHHDTVNLENNWRKKACHQQDTVQKLPQEPETLCAGLLDCHAISKDVNLHTGSASEHAACDIEDGVPQHMITGWSKARSAEDRRRGVLSHITAIIAYNC